MGAESYSNIIVKEVIEVTGTGSSEWEPQGSSILLVGGLAGSAASDLLQVIAALCGKSLGTERQRLIGIRFEGVEQIPGTTEDPKKRDDQPKPNAPVSLMED